MFESMLTHEGYVNQFGSLKGSNHMSRQLAVKFVAGTVAAGALTFGLALPAQATTTPDPETTTVITTEPSAPASEPAPAAAPAAAAAATKAAPTKRASYTLAQLNAGVTLKLGSTGEAVSEVQRRLNVLGILVPVNGVFGKSTANGVARFNEKFRGTEAFENKTLSAAGWGKLRSVTARGDRVPAICKKKAAALCISKSQRIVRYFVRGKLVTALDARFGGPGNRTRNGNFKIFRKVWNDFSSEYKTPMPHSMYFSGGQAVHYSMFFNAVGYNGASHGCINTRDKAGIKSLWRKVKLGTFTKVYN